MWHSLHNCTVILQTAHYCLRNYTFAFILQFLCTYRQSWSCAQKTKPNCIAPLFSPSLWFCTDGRSCFDLKSFNCPSTACQVGYFHVWQAWHFHSSNCMWHDQTVEPTPYHTQQMFSISSSWGQSLFARGWPWSSVELFFSHALSVLPGDSGFLCLLSEEWGSAGW